MNEAPRISHHNRLSSTSDETSRPRSFFVGSLLADRGDRLRSRAGHEPSRPARTGQFSFDVSFEGETRRSSIAPGARSRRSRLTQPVDEAASMRPHSCRSPRHLTTARYNAPSRWRHLHFIRLGQSCFLLGMVTVIRLRCRARSRRVGHSMIRKVSHHCWRPVLFALSVALSSLFQTPRTVQTGIRVPRSLLLSRARKRAAAGPSCAPLTSHRAFRGIPASARVPSLVISRPIVH